MKKVRIGIFGARRGKSLASTLLLLNCEIVALCDKDKAQCERIVSELPRDVAYYDNFDEFIEHPMDAVIIANFFHEHAPYAIKCLEKGIHVYSECLANGTMAEGVELIRAAEKSKAIYMLAENYVGMYFNRELKRICDGGTLGKILLGEGEYNHSADPADLKTRKALNYSPMHWRNFCPRTYYVTHSLAPLMHMTGATPRRVSAFAIFSPPDPDRATVSRQGDVAAVITTQNDDGSVFRITGCTAFGAHHKSYRLAGTKGQAENVRGMQNKIMLRYDEWQTPEGCEPTRLYEPVFNDPDEELIKKSGHFGGDFLVARIFIDCIRSKKQPPSPLDVHSAVAMSSVAILSHRSMLEGGVPYDIPDFHTEEARAKYENDRISPFPKADGSVDIPCCSHPDYTPSKQQMENYMNLIQQS